MAVVEGTLNERGARYGLFGNQAYISQGLTEFMHEQPGWKKLKDHQKESLEMIQHKVARILNGDPNYADSWHDIAGYATLVEKYINGEEI